MNAKELHDEWESGDSNGMRPQRVQRLRDDLTDATGLPIPRRIPEIEAFMDTMSGQVTRKLREAVENEDDPPPDGE